MRTANPLAALRAIQAGDDAPASDSPRESPVGRESLADALTVDDELGYPGVLSLGIPAVVKVRRHTLTQELRMTTTQQVFIDEGGRQMALDSDLAAILEQEGLIDLHDELDETDRTFHYFICEPPDYRVSEDTPERDRLWSMLHFRIAILHAQARSR